MSGTAVAERYARAIFELGAEAGQLPAFTDQLSSVAQAYSSSPELRALLDSPLVDEAKRSATLEAVGRRLGAGPTLLNALKVLVQRRRTRALPEIARRLVELADGRAGVVRASVTSATALAAPQLERIKQELERLTGKRVVLEQELDPALLAGLVTRVGDHRIDTSLRGRIEELERRLAQSPA